MANQRADRLRLHPRERDRFRAMARQARIEEGALWRAAGIRSGARVADVGCGPGGSLFVLADEVGSGGRVDGVDRDPRVVEMARDEIADLDHVTVRQGDAARTGLEPGTYDVVMCRHVLAHNPDPGAIVTHLAELAAPGGTVYLVDADATTTRTFPEDPDIADLTARFHALHRAHGSDPSIGCSLGALLTTAGLTVELFRSGGPVIPMPAGMRPPSWAAREALVAEGLATPADLARWAAAFGRVDALPARPWLSNPTFIAIGRRAG